MKTKSKNKLSHNQKMEIIYICKEHETRKKSIRFLLDALTSEELENPRRYSNSDLKKVIAVELALKKLSPQNKIAIWNNITNRIAYDYVDIPMCKDNFYRLKNDFLADIQQQL